MPIFESWHLCYFLLRIAKIRDGYMFKSKNPNGAHFYAVYYDGPSISYRTIGLTHIYNADPKRVSQVKAKILKKVKLPQFETPSGVKKYYQDHNLEGGKIDLKDGKNVLEVSKRHLPPKLSEEIKNFANTKEEVAQQPKKKKKPRSYSTCG